MPEYEMGISEPSKAAGIAMWKIAIGCAAIVGVGLAIGLSVGLTKDPVIEYVQATDTPTDKPPSTTSTTSTTSGTKPGTAAPPPSTTPAASNAPTTTPMATTTAPMTTLADGEAIWEDFRLPKNIIPSHYRLSLHPNMTTNIYTGTNAMTFNVTGTTKYVLVHAHATLNISGVTLEHKGGASIGIEKEFRYPEYEFYVVKPEAELTEGEYVITMDFQNFLDKAIVGIYKATYIDAEDGIEKGIVGSDMEPTDARRGYPCFDEPALKVRYTTSIVHDLDHTALSNMPVKEITTRPDGLNETLFEESVPMSTYLGCFVVSEFEYKEVFSDRGIPLRVYAPKYQLERGQVDYAVKVTKIIFDEFEQLFGMNYSLPKCDQISIPNFGTGAMENWGLITYRETNLLWDPVQSSTSNKQRVVAVIAHELVHQWFGNIVTMKWWDNIWLNEGFASYFEYVGIKAAEPTWQIMDSFVNSDLQRAMRSDSSVASYPVVVEVSTPSEISEVFSTIIYSKGATVLRMMRDFIGDDNFFGGIKNYLQKRQFSVADQQDLWDDIQEYITDNGGGYNVSAFMDPFVLQMGYPVLNVTLPDDPADGPTITQMHFLTDSDADLSERPPSDFDYKWNVEVSYYTSDNATVSKTMLESKDDTHTLVTSGTFNSSKWIKLNANEIGYYRVNYAGAIWDNIALQLENDFSVFTETDRSHIMDDGFNLAPAKKIPYTTALNLTTYLDAEEGYLVWDAFSTGSSYIRQMLQSTDIYPDFQEYYLSRVKPIADKLGWNASEGTHEEKLNRETVLALALRYGDDDALNEAAELFEDWLNGAHISPDIRRLVYRYGILSATEEDWNYMLARYIDETVATEKSNLLRGLAATEDVKLIDRLLNYTKDPAIIKSQDFFNCITYISYSVNGNQMAWTWTQLNWEYMVDRFGIQDRNLGRLVPNIVYPFNTDLQYWEVDSFFKRYPEAGAGERNRETALLQIKLNTAWMAENQQDIADWLTDQLSGMS